MQRYMAFTSTSVVSPMFDASIVQQSNTQGEGAESQLEVTEGIAKVKADRAGKCAYWHAWHRLSMAV